MKKMKRRRFLKTGVGVAGALSIPGFWIPKSAHSASLGPKKLVMFFLSGGNDGQNTIVPYRTFDNSMVEVTDEADLVNNPAKTQYDYYRLLRPTVHLNKGLTGEQTPTVLPLGPITGDSNNMHRIAMPSSTGFVPAGHCEFAMHPSMQGLVDIWDDGNLAIFPAAHCGPNANRSHFFQTEYYGHGLNTEHTNQGGDGKGWVGRYFEGKYGLTPSPTRIEGFDFESSYFPLFDSNIPVLGSSNPGSIDLGDDGGNIRDKVLEINASRNASSNSPYGQYAEVQQALFDKIAKLSGVTFTQPPNGSNPYYSSFFGYETSTARRFRQAAAMIKDSNVGLEIEVINIDRGGFDTHGDQVDPNSGNSADGSHSRTLRDVADSIKAFYDDLNSAGCGDDVITVVQTEFGRTADENNNFGTDHARASCWFALGGKVNGGLYGTWPGTAIDFSTGITDLDGGSRKYLFQSVDYRDILAELIRDFMDKTGPGGTADPAASFNPNGFGNYTFPTGTNPAPLGFVDTT